MTTILERIANGDETAANDCVREYGGLVWRIARRYLDHAESEVEDAVQDVFIEIWLYAKRFDPAKGSEPAFVATLAHRRLIDRQRRILARRRKLDRYAQELSVGVRTSPNAIGADHSPDPGSYREELERGFCLLPEDERNALWMSVYRGLSHREISEAIEVPIGTVKSRLRRAMIRLTKSILGNQVSTGAKGGES